MFAIDEGDGSVQYRIADVANQKTADVPKLGCGRYCVLVWLPGFQTVGHLESNGTMTAYDLATGHKTGTLKFQAYNATAWSPDGTKIVTDKAVVDQQGRQLCTLNLGNTTRTYWLDSSTFMIMNERVRIVGADCRVQESSPLPRSWVVTEPSEYTMGHD
jgi:hypothetical protein